MSEGIISRASWRGLISGQVSPVRVATDRATITGTGTVDDPLVAAFDGVDVESSGSPLAGNPHSTLNFIGATVVDAGGGKANITISGGGSGLVPLLGFEPRGDQYGVGDNMAEGTLNPYTDPNLGSVTCITVAGADNGATRLTGMDNTGVADGTIVAFLNHPGDGRANRRHRGERQDQSGDPGRADRAPTIEPGNPE